MLTLRKRKGPQWWAYWRDAEGRQRFRSTGKTDYADAMKAAALLVLSDLQALAPIDEKPRTDATIAEAVNWYREYAKTSPRNLSDKRAKPRTVEGYTRNTARLGKLAKVMTVGDLRAIASELSARYIGLTEAAYVTVVRGAGAGLFSEGFLAWLRAEKRVDLSNPLLGNIPPVRRPQPFYAWSPERLNQLKAAAETELAGKPEYTLFLLCLGGGLRRSEATFSTWEDVTDVGISVRWRSSHGTKSDSSARTIPVAQALLDKLRAKRPKSATMADYVVPDGEVCHRDETKYDAPQFRCERACRRLMAWLRAHGIDSRNPLHHLRRLCGSEWERLYGLRQASYWLGHSDVVVTSKHYVGLRAEAVAGW